MVAFIAEFWMFLKVRKKFWLLPILLALAILGIMTVVSGGSILSPLVYTLF